MRKRGILDIQILLPPYYFGPHLPVSGIGRAKVKAEDAVKANASPTAAKLGPRPCVPAKNQPLDYKKNHGGIERVHGHQRR